MEGKNQENTAIFGKTDRRGFFRNLGKLAIAAVGANYLGLTPQIAVAESQPATKELTRREILNDPLTLIDQFIDKINALPEGTKRNLAQTELIRNYSKNSSDFKSEEDSQMAANNRKKLEAGYKLIGDDVDDLLTRIDKTKIYSQDSDLDLAFPFFTRLWRPFEHLYQGLNARNSDSNKTAFLTFEDVSSLESITSWFQFLDSGTYDEQKARYIEWGKQGIDNEHLEDGIKLLWKDVMKEQRFEITDNADRRDNRELDGFLEIIGKFNEFFPLGLSNFDTVEFLNRKESRSYETSVVGQKREYLPYGFFDFFRKMRDTSQTGENLVYTAQDDLAFFLTTMQHETGHGVDPFNHDGVEIDVNRFISCHPKDFVNYFKNYVDQYTAFYYFLDNAKADDIETYFMDVLSPKGNGSSGTDQLETKLDAEMFGAECDSLAMIFNIVNNSHELKKFVAEIGIDKFFTGRDGDFMNWKVRLESSVPGFSTRDSKKIKNNISSFNVMSATHLDQLKNFAVKLVNDPNGNDEVSKKVILDMKNMYTYVCFKLTRGLAQNRDQKLIKIFYNSLFNQHRYFEGKVNWQIAHMLTGGPGQYLEDLVPDIRMTSDDVASELTYIETFRRDDVKGIVKKIDPKFNYSPLAMNLINTFPIMQELVANARATMWGSKEKVDPYAKFAKAIFDFFGIPLYPPSRLG